MSEYKNFVEDFPRRCMEVYDNLYSDALNMKKEVTFMLMVASASILVPFERIRPTYGNDPIHPSEDAIKFKEHADNLKNLLDGDFKESLLWSEDFENWRYGESYKNTFNPNRIDENKLKKIPKDYNVAAILFLIRNALAHGNIYTIEDPIKNIYFVSWKKKDENIVGVKYIRVTPIEFNIFLYKWIDFLTNNKIDTFTLGLLLNQIRHEELSTQ